MRLLHAMTDSEKERMHAGVLRILEEMGLQVESQPILRKLESFGARVDYANQTARFPAKLITQFLESAERVAADDREPRLDCRVDIYMGKYLDPATDRFEDWTEDRLARYVKVAKALPNVRGVGMLCCPVSAPLEIHPLYSKYLNWKLGMDVNAAIHNVALCPFIEEFHGIRAERLGIEMKSSISGCIFLISPLKLPRTEAEQFLYFAERGYPCSCSNMTTMGGSGPVTIPGSVALHLAEDIFCNILQRLYYGTRKLLFLCSISNLDMRRASFCYGRPEKAIASLLHGQMAERYGGEHVGQTGLADAKRPGAEAATQKMLTTVTELLYFKSGWLNAGLLSGDEIFSPIEMILDNEMAGALMRLVRREPVDENTLAFDTIREAGYGGVFTDKDHTFEHFREALWDSSLWSHALFDAWQIEGGKTAEMLALERWREIMAAPDPAPAMDEATDRKLRALMDRALKHVRGKKN